MGKRKSSKIKPKTNKIPKLDKEFDCPFCSHSKAVKVELDRVRGVGSLSCRICGAVYNRAITRLDEGIDVYGDWIDACVSANAEAAKEAQLKLEKSPATPQGPSSRGGPPAGTPEAASDEEARDIAKAKRERFAHSGGRVNLKKLSRDAESEGERSSSEEAEGASAGGGPKGSQGAPSRKRLKVDKDREETETAAAAESEGSDAETHKGGDRNAEVGGVLEQYRQEAEGEEEEEDNALFHDDE